jgi:hypothetical protein
MFIRAKIFKFNLQTAIVNKSREEDVRNTISQICMMVLVLLHFFGFSGFFK